MWIGSITIGWEGDKRIRKTVSAKTGAAVREKLRVAQAKIDAGLPLDDDKLTVNQLLDRWFNDVMRLFGFWRGVAPHRTTIEPRTRQFGLPA
jgi:hypothetical protein